VILAIKIGSIVLALILLLRLKVNLSFSIFLLSVYTVVLFRISAKTALISAGQVLTEDSTLQLFMIITMVVYVAAVQKSRRMFDKLVSSLNFMIRDTRIVAMVTPAVIGFLPMPGGALVSAPLVDISTENMNMTGEFKTFMNYWFRHLWEFIWPVYAGLLIFANLSGIPMKTIILYQAPFTIFNIITGLIVSFLYFKKHHIKRRPPQRLDSFSRTIKDFFEGVWPILLVILLFFILSIPLHFSLALTAVILTLVKRVKIKEAIHTFFSKSTAGIVLLIGTVMIFKKMIQISDAFTTLKTMEVSAGMVVLFAFLVSFTMGFLTGVNTAYIVIAYPILLPLLQDFTGVHFTYLSLYVYVIGFAGILLSPIHLCLLLTNEYFKSSLYKVYRYLAPPGIALALAATILALVL
jgi:integral membrane protein (TIGR00529 family)